VTYIINAISLGANTTIQADHGSIIAEPDEPLQAFMLVERQTLIGQRYLLVTDDGSGYRSSAELVHVPHNNELPTRVSIPREVREDLRRALETLLESAPTKQLAVYLEANRAISRCDPDDPHPPEVVLREHESLDEFWKLALLGRIVEDEIHVVRS
jgi:hypothetical protein